MDRQPEKLNGLFINSAKANCSIYESGKMCYDCLTLSAEFQLDYQEISVENRTIDLQYDFYVFNYHFVTMGWLDTSTIQNLPGIKFTIILEILPDNPFAYCSKVHFDGYLVLDPTLNALENNVHIFPRPLEANKPNFNLQNHEIPVFGSFGFATSGKGFEKVVKAVNDEFDQALIKINIPYGDFTSKEQLEKILKSIEKINRKPQITLEITHHYFEKEKLIEWCADNTLNIFLYHRNIAGLSATTDQAISSGRPLAISTDYTFRHIHPYIKPYPFRCLKESILLSQKEVENIITDWTSQAFKEKFEQVLTFHRVGRLNLKSQQFQLITLPTKRQKITVQISEFVPPIIYRIIKKIRNKNRTHKDGYPTLSPFVHPVLNSFSQFNEDLLLDVFFSYKKNGFYVDIGANHPVINSNTKRFYQRGWNGINIEPDPIAFIKVSKLRERDINLNIAISESDKVLEFFQLADDSTLSTLDEKTAQNMAKRLGLAIKVSKVQSLPLSTVLDENMVSSSIDFMTVDAEGHDLSVLISNNWDKYRPSIIMVESNYQFEDIRNFLDLQEYLHIFSNNYNAIFIDKLTDKPEILEKIGWIKN